MSGRITSRECTFTKFNREIKHKRRH